MKKTLLFCACFMLVGFSVRAAPSRLEESEVSASNLKSILGERFGTSIDEDGGKISQGVLEMSNVDLSAEFTDMITTQRGFQANSRIITTSDSMLEELVNLKR